MPSLAYWSLIGTEKMDAVQAQACSTSHLRPRHQSGRCIGAERKQQLRGLHTESSVDHGIALNVTLAHDSRASTPHPRGTSPVRRPREWLAPPFRKASTRVDYRPMGSSEPVPRPTIRYVTSRDGTRLAMAEWGTGPPAVGILLHLGDKLEAPGVIMRQWCRVLGRHLTFVRYDARGCGLSERRAHRISLEACLEDLEAVLDALGPEPVTFVGASLGAAAAVQFAALHPERVERLVVYGGSARGLRTRAPDAAHDKEANAILGAVEVAFGGDVAYRAPFRRTINSRFFPSATAQQLDEVDEVTGDRLSGDVVRAYAAMTQEIDVSESARQVRCPTLVFHARGDLLIPFAEGSRLASLIPQARFVPIDDDSSAPLEGNPHWPEIEAALGEFFGWEKSAAPASIAILTGRQIEVLLLVGEGRTDKEIARELSLSPRTVEMHVARAMRTLQSRTRAEAALQAAKRGLLG